MVGKMAVYIVQHIPDIIAGMGNLVQGIWNVLKQLPGILFNVAKEAITSFLSAIVPDSVKRKFNQVKDAVTKPIEAARDAIKKAIDKIKSFFNITLKFKGIKMPHISVSWKKTGALAKAAQFIGLDGIPSFSVSWYKTGGIFSDPSVIGIGEAGPEAVVPLDKLWEKFDQMAEAIIAASGNRVINQEININQPVSTPIETARAIKKQMEFGLAGG